MAKFLRPHNLLPHLTPMYNYHSSLFSLLLIYLVFEYLIPCYHYNVVFEYLIPCYHYNVSLFTWLIIHTLLLNCFWLLPIAVHLLTHTFVHSSLFLSTDYHIYIAISHTLFLHNLFLYKFSCMIFICLSKATWTLRY